MAVGPKGLAFTQASPAIAARQHQQRLRPCVGAIVCSAGASSPSGELRKLIIMRHADSEDPKALPGVRDHDRPITAAGRTAARDIAEQLAAAGWLPQVLICSNAVRSRQTLEAMRDALPALDYADVHFLGSLYTISQLDGQTRAHLEEVVAGEASGVTTCVLCLGHNKGWEEAAVSFSGEELKLDNCCAALLEGRGESWDEAFGEGATWRLAGLLRPGNGV